MGYRPLCLECEADATQGRNAESAKGSSTRAYEQVEGRRKRTESRRLPTIVCLGDVRFHHDFGEGLRNGGSTLIWTRIRPGAYGSSLSILAVLLSSQGKRR